jgi:hypothetical protein
MLFLGPLLCLCCSSAYLVIIECDLLAQGDNFELVVDRRGLPSCAFRDDLNTPIHWQWVVARPLLVGLFTPLLLTSLVTRYASSTVQLRLNDFFVSCTICALLRYQAECFLSCLHPGGFATTLERHATFCSKTQVMLRSTCMSLRIHLSGDSCSCDLSWVYAVSTTACSIAQGRKVINEQSIIIANIICITLRCLTTLNPYRFRRCGRTGWQVEFDVNWVHQMRTMKQYIQGRIRRRGEPSLAHARHPDRHGYAWLSS